MIFSILYCSATPQTHFSEGWLVWLQILWWKGFTTSSFCAIILEFKDLCQLKWRCLVQGGERKSLKGEHLHSQRDLCLHTVCTVKTAICCPGWVHKKTRACIIYRHKPKKQCFFLILHLHLKMRQPGFRNRFCSAVKRMHICPSDCGKQRWLEAASAQASAPHYFCAAVTRQQRLLRGISPPLSVHYNTRVQCCIVEWRISRGAANNHWKR